MKFVFLGLILFGVIQTSNGEGVSREEFETIQKEALKIQEQKFKRFEEEIGELRQELSAVKAAASPSAAFSVRLSEDTELSDSALIYDIVDLNIGDGYDEFTGVFSPPIDGVYLLTVYATSVELNGPMYLKRNDDVLCWTQIPETHLSDGSTCSAIAQLSISDSVFVSGENDNSAQIRGQWSGFVGHIISDGLTV